MIDTLWQAAWTLFSFAREPATAMASVDRAVALFEFGNGVGL